MKKRIYTSVLFLVLLLGLLTGLSWIFLPKNNTYEAGMQLLESYNSGYLAEPENAYDLLALGDSLTANAMIPPELWQNYGICSYELCGPNQALTKALYYLNRFTQKQHPKVVLLEAYELYQPITQELVLEDLGSPILPIFKYHDNWKRPQSLDPFSLPSYTKHTIFQGFYAAFAQESCEPVNYMVRDKVLEEVSPACMYYLREIYRRCQEENIQLILFSIPSQYSWDWGRHLGAQAAADALGIPYLDLNVELPTIDWTTDSTDGGNHLNYLGGTKVTAYMGNYIYKTGLLPDHRNDPAYTGWNDIAEALNQWVETEVTPVLAQSAP